MQRTPKNRPSAPPPARGVCRHPDAPLRAGLYARVSTADQQSLPDQIDQLRAYALARGWVVVLEEPEVGSGARDRPGRRRLTEAARRRRDRRHPRGEAGPVGSSSGRHHHQRRRIDRAGRRLRGAGGFVRPDDRAGTGHAGDARRLPRPSSATGSMNGSARGSPPRRPGGSGSAAARRRIVTARKSARCSPRG